MYLTSPLPFHQVILKYRTHSHTLPSCTQINRRSASTSPVSLLPLQGELTPQTKAFGLNLCEKTYNRKGLGISIFPRFSLRSGVEGALRALAPFTMRSSGEGFLGVPLDGCVNINSSSADMRPEVS